MDSLTVSDAEKIANWPIYFKDALIIKNKASNIGIATLWMPKESVADVLDKDGIDYCACGQLYTKRGINPMFRNIFANPTIRYIVLCGVDRQGSGDALLKFFANGFTESFGESGDRKGWTINGDPEALLDKEFTLAALSDLKQAVEIFDLRMQPLTKIKELTKTFVQKEAFCKPVLFPEPKQEVISKFPSDTSVFKIRRETISDAWVDALKVINRFGVEVPGMYSNVKEVHNLSIVVEKEDPTTPVLPEFLNFGKEGLDLYIKGFFDTDLQGQAYTYGERIFTWDTVDQYKQMAEKLTRYPYDRGALAVLWKPHVDNFPPKKTEIKTDGQTKGWKVPCLVMILAQCIEGKLNMTCVFRNNDIYGAWPLNAFALRTLQQRLAVEIGQDMGVLTTVSHIAEIYDTDWSDSLKIVKDNDNTGRTCQWDPRGYYTVELDGNDIVLKFFNPEGSTKLAEFVEDGTKPKVARDMCALAIKDMLISDLGAAADLGRQLAKAETAVKLGLKFTQDQPLSLTQKA